MILITKQLQRRAYNYCEASIDKQLGPHYYHKYKSYPLLNHYGFYKRGQVTISLSIPDHIVLGFGYPTYETVVESDSDMWLSLYLEDSET